MKEREIEPFNIVDLILGNELQTRITELRTYIRYYDTEEDDANKIRIFSTSIASKVEVKLETTTTFSGGLSDRIERSKSSRT